MEDSRLNCLPAEIKLNIFSRLQAELVLDCKQVCRAWRDFIRVHANTNYFANLHLRCQQGDGIIHQESHQPCHDDGSGSATMSFLTFFRKQDLYFEEYYHDKMNPRKDYYKKRRIGLKFLVDDEVKLVGSCNGLICLSVTKSYKKLTSFTYNDSYDESLYICNPIIGEIVNLPGKYINNKEQIVYGFGYHPLTCEYKVIRIFYESPCKGQVEVYTLGSGSGWRSKGEFSYRVLTNSEYGSVCVNGALHWLRSGSGDIVAFDLADERFHLLQSLPNEMQGICRSSVLGIFRGCLVLVNQCHDGATFSWHLWFLNKNKEGNSSYNTKEFYGKIPCWSKEYTITNVGCKDGVPHLLSLLEGGQVLLVGIFCGYIFRYNLESHVTEDIWVPDEKEKCWAWSVPIPHRNSFVSLRALGEQNVTTSKEQGKD